MVQEPDVFTLDLQDLNNSVVFVVSLSNQTGKHVKVSQTGSLAVFPNMESFEAFLPVSKVCRDSSPYEVTFTKVKEIALAESEGIYQILN
jgi:hypothetical protein